MSKFNDVSKFQRFAILVLAIASGYCVSIGRYGLGIFLALATLFMIAAYVVTQLSMIMILVKTTPD